MIGMFVWNDASMLCILNFDIDLKLIISQCDKSYIFQHHAIIFMYIELCIG